MQSRPHPLSLDELHLLRWVLGGVLMLLSIATVFYMDVGSEALTLLAMGGVLAALVKPELPARVPLWAHRLAFPAILLFFVGDLWRSGQLLSSVVRLDLLLLLYRGMSHRARRDDLQIVVLGLFLIVVAGVLTVSLLFAVQILVFTAVALCLLMVVTIAGSAEGGTAPLLAVRGVVPGWASHAGWRRFFSRLWAVADLRLLASAAAIFAGVVVVAGLLFMAIPRFQLENSLFLERFIARKAMTGFSDSIKFGDITDIIQDDGIAFDVDVSDRTQAPVTPYWRMVVLDEYRNGGFKLSAGLKAREVLGTERTASFVNTQGHGTLGAPTWTVYLEAGVSRYLPLVGSFDVLRFREAQNFRFSSILGIVSLRDEPVSMTAYRIEGMAADSAQLPDPIFAGRWQKTHASNRGIPLQNSLDSLSPADRLVLTRLAREIGPAGTGAAAFGARASAWLRGRHGYSLSPRFPPGPGDPLIRWMDSREPGHCELFAGALVLAAREAGIPARVVTGFKGGTWNAYSGNYTIRNSDAHAWTELWDSARGAWVRVDPLATAAEQATAQKGDAALAVLSDRSWSARINSIRVFWYRRIVNFDQQAQVDTIKAVKSATDTSGKWLRDAIAGLVRSAKAYLVSPWNVARSIRAAAVLAAAVLLAWAGLGGYRAFRLRGAGAVDPVRREAGLWLRRLEGPPELVADLQRLRFGAAPTWPAPTEVFRRARRERASSRRRRGPAGASRRTS